MVSATATGERARPARGTSRWLGGLVLGCSLVVALTLVFGFIQPPRGDELFTIYPSSAWVLLGGLVVAGVLLAVSGTPQVRSAAAALGGIVAAQLGGMGIVTVRHWDMHYDLNNGYHVPMDRLQFLAAATAVAMLVAVLGCAIVLTGQGLGHASALVRGLAIAVGLFLIVAVPILLAAGHGGLQDAASIVAFLLVYAIPWGGGLLATAPLARIPALTMALTVGACAFMAPFVTDNMTYTEQMGLAPSVVCVSALIILASRVRD